MERIKNYIDTLLEHHDYLVKHGSWADQRFCLGKIEGLRSALMLLNAKENTIPSWLVA